MSVITHDRAATRSTAGGFGFAVLSAASFGLSGTLATGLMAAGWSAAAAVTARVLIASVVLAGPAVVMLRGRWHQLVAQRAVVAAYGVIAVAGCQLAYFNAVHHMQVGTALLIEYAAPLVVVLWIWARHGQRPTRLTTIGGLVAVVGLVLVLDLVGGLQPSPVGVAWALCATAGAAVYFVLSASSKDDALPALVLAAAGLVVGGALLLVAGALGALPMHASTRPVVLGSHAWPFWVPLGALGVVTAAAAYVSGIIASRRLGARLASFVALGEVLFALVFAWALLGQLPRAVQLLGAALVLTGVIVVKAGEPAQVIAPPEPQLTQPGSSSLSSRRQRRTRGRDRDAPQR